MILHFITTVHSAGCVKVGFNHLEGVLQSPLSFFIYRSKLTASQDRSPQPTFNVLSSMPAYHLCCSIWFPGSLCIFFLLDCLRQYSGPDVYQQAYTATSYSKKIISIPFSLPTLFLYLRLSYDNQLLCIYITMSNLMDKRKFSDANVPFIKCHTDLSSHMKSIMFRSHGTFCRNL